MASTHMKRCSILLLIREMQIKTTMRYNFTLIKWKITSAGKDIEKVEPSYIAGENMRWYSHSGKQFGGSTKSNKELYDPAIPLLSIPKRNENIYPEKNLYINVKSYL